MKSIPSLRMPFREDTLFGILFLITLSVPLTFTLYTTDNFEIIKASLFFVLAGSAILVWLKRFAGGAVQVRYHAVFFAFLVIFFIWTLLSAVFSIDPGLSVFGFYPRFTSGALFLTSFAVFTYLMVSTASFSRWVLLVKVLVFDALLVSVIGILQSYGYGYYESLEGLGLMRAPSLIGNPNFSSMFIAAVIPFSAVLMWKSGTFRAKVYYGVGIFLMLWSLSVFASRGAFAGLIAAILVSSAGIFWFRVPKRVVVAGLLSLILAAVLSVTVYGILRPHSIRNTLDLSDVNISMRFFAWDVARQAMIEHPWFGTGLGTFQIYYESHRNSYVAAETGNFDDPHNILFHLAASGGIPLALSFLGLMGTSLFFAARQLKERDPMALAVIASMAAFLVSASFTPVSSACYVLLAIVMVGPLITGTKESVIKIRPAARGVVGLAGAVLILWGIALIASDAVFYQGRAAYQKKDFQRSYDLTKAAFTINPTNQIYYLYMVGSDIKLKADQGKIEKEIQKLVAMHPAAAYSYDRAAHLYYSWYELDYKGYPFAKAIEYIGKAVEMEPYRSARYQKIALYYFEANDMDKSKEYVKTALSLDKQQLTSWILLAKIYQIQGNRQGVVSSLENAYKAYPEHMQTATLLKMAKSQIDIKDLPLTIVLREGTLE